VCHYPRTCRQLLETYHKLACKLLYLAIMSKSSKRCGRGPRRAVDRSATTDIVTQLEVVLRNPHAAAIGALIGGLVPWFGRTLAHGEIQEAWSSNQALALAMSAVVIGCGLFSGLSVYKFGRAAFGDPRKALGFVLALEGVMLVSHGVTSAVALMVLILINAVANGSVIALARDATCRKRAADARGAATRASSRARCRGGARAPATEECPQAPYKSPASPPVPTKESPVPPGYAPYHAPVAPLWHRPSFNTVIDAEIMSETRFLA
jgi:hypothetical protein